MTGKAATRRNPVTPELWQLHLNGEQRLGIVPVMKDAKCWWFCIDVDHYQEEGLLEQIADKIASLGLPLVMTRSKSGGAHLWCFLLEPITAAIAQHVAKNWIKRLDLPDGHVDVFPAQGDVLDVGNWMNMPYFGDQCHGAGEDGKQDQTIPEFEEYANARLVDPDDLKALAKKAAPKAAAKHEKKTGSQLPPCIDHYLDEGIPDGGRNNVVTHFAVVYKAAYPDDWADRVKEVNKEHCDPELPRDEMSNILKSVKTRDFQYLCNKVREAGGFCDRLACKKRDFGVKGGSNGTDTPLPIDSITKIKGEKPMYKIVSATGVEFQLTLSEVFNYQKFREAFLGAVDIYLMNMKNDEWAERLNVYLETMATLEAAPDTQMGERVISSFKLFGARANTDNLELALQRGLPFYDAKDRKIVFRGDDFMQLIDRSLKLEREKTWVYMEREGCVQSDYDVGGKPEKLWCFQVKGELWFNPFEGEQA